MVDQKSARRATCTSAENIILPLSIVIGFCIDYLLGEDWWPLSGTFYIAAWTCVFDLIYEFFYSYEFLQKDPTNSGCPMAANACGIVHQLGLCSVIPICLLLIAHFTCGLHDWWVGDWDEGPFTLRFLARHVFYATFGLEFKDLWHDGMNAAFLVHHMFAFAGLLVCLFFDAGVGIVILNGASAEFGSGFYNLIFLLPGNSVVFFLYVIIMTLSNGFAIFALVELLDLSDAVALGFRITYAILCIGLVALRMAGVCLELWKYYHPAEKEGTASGGSDSTGTPTVESSAAMVKIDVA